MSDEAFKALGIDINRSDCETRSGQLIAPEALLLPINEQVTPSTRGDGLFVGIVDDQLIVGIGLGAQLAFHLRFSADESRSAALAFSKAANLLDGGRGRH